MIQTNFLFLVWQLDELVIFRMTDNRCQMAVSIDSSVVAAADFLFPECFNPY